MWVLGVEPGSPGRAASAVTAELSLQPPLTIYFPLSVLLLTHCGFTEEMFNVMSHFDKILF